MRKLISYLISFTEVYLFFFLTMSFLAGFMQVFWIDSPNYQDNNVIFSYNFTSFLKSFYTVFIYFTQNNTPEIILKPYPNHKHIMVLFYVLLHALNVIVTAMIIGLSYYKIKLAMHANIAKVCKHHVTKQAFDKLLDYPHVSREYVKNLLTAYNEGNVRDFYSVNQMMEVHYKRGLLPRTASQFIYDALARMKSYEFFYALIDIVIVLFGVFVIQTRQFNRHHYYMFMILLCCISSLDFAHTTIFTHIGNKAKTWKTIVSFALNVVIILLSIVLLIDQLRNIVLVKLWGFVSILKILRFAIFYFKFDTQKLTTLIFRPFGSYIVELISILFILYLFFGMIGLNMFGGVINGNTMGRINEVLGTDLDYVNINFNTFFNSFISFYIVGLNDNWPMIVHMSVFKHEGSNTYGKIVFLLFKLIVNFILINSLTAFAIEIFNDYEHGAVYANPDLYVETEGPDRAKTYDELSQIFQEELYQNLDRTTRK